MTLLRPGLISALLITAAAALPIAALAADDFSPAERALFMANQLAAVRPPATLRYTYRKTGSLEEAFDDQVELNLRAQADGKCCSAAGRFLSGTRKLELNDIEAATANPVILFFLERDIREMERLTKGKQNYFRKRIRMAVYQGATLRPVSLTYRGATVQGQEIAISPYLDDPNRAKFEKLANKSYLFTLSDAVPGGVYAIRSRIDGETPQAPALIVEELLVDGARNP